MARPERGAREMIANLSRELLQLYESGHALTDPLLVAHSQKMDQLIVDWRRQHPNPQREF